MFLTGSHKWKMNAHDRGDAMGESPCIAITILNYLINSCLVVNSHHVIILQMYFFFWCKCSEHDTACSMGTCTYSLQVFINGSSNIRSLLHKFCVTLSCLTVLRRGFATSGVLKAVDSKLKVTGSNPSLVSKCLHPYLLSLRMNIFLF